MKKIENLVRGLLISLIPVIVFSIAIMITSTSNTPHVKHYPEVIRPGYQTEPAKYVVEASYAKYWKDSRSVGLIVLAYLVIVAGTVFVIHYVNDKGVKGGNYYLALVWLAGGLLIFVPMARIYGSSSYQSTLTVQEYEDNKSNLDALFPSIESTPK